MRLDALAQAVGARLVGPGDRVVTRHASYADVADVLRDLEAPAPFAMLLDVGLSSFQLDDPERGFAFRFEGKDDDIDVLHPGGGKFHAEFSEWRWETLERLPDLIVPFKRSVYEEVVAAFRHIAK